MSKKRKYGTITLPREDKELLTKLKGGVYNYPSIIQYLLIKSGFRDKEGILFDYDVADSIIGKNSK